MELKLHDGKEKVQLSDSTFGREYNESLVHQVVTAYMAGGRQGTRAQKNRSQVRGGGAKPFRQKGTGRARAGTIRSPLWRSGGVTFAARPQDHTQKVNKKMYRGAMRAIFSELARRGNLMLVDAFTLDTPKTKTLATKLKDMGLEDVLIVTEGLEQNLYLASRNLMHVHALAVESVDPVSLLRCRNVLMTTTAAKRLEEWLG